MATIDEKTNMSEPDYEALTDYAKRFSGLTPEYEALLTELGPRISPKLGDVTDSFYSTLLQIDKAAPFLEGKLDQLKATHHHWLERLFTGPYDSEYTTAMYRVGEVHVRVKLPVEFMAGGITLICNALLPEIAAVYGDDRKRCTEATAAVNAMLGFSLMVMQESYQTTSLAAELERFLAITGMSRALFDNLAQAYSD